MRSLKQEKSLIFHILLYMSKWNVSIFQQLSFYEQLKIQAQFSWAWKKFYDRRAKNASRKFIGTVKLYFPSKWKHCRLLLRLCWMQHGLTLIPLVLVFLKKLSAYYISLIYSNVLKNALPRKQTLWTLIRLLPRGAVWSWSILFAILATKIHVHNMR